MRGFVAKINLTNTKWTHKKILRPQISEYLTQKCAEEASIDSVVFKVINF